MYLAFDLNLGAQSRTVYGPENEGGTAQSIFWGNYVAGEKENIRVFCTESPAGRNMAEYEVNYSLDANNRPNDNTFHADHIPKMETRPDYDQNLHIRYL